MIKNLYLRVRERISSLYVTLLLVIILGMIMGVGVYALSRLIWNSYISTTYLSDENIDGREKEHIERLQEYITNNNLTSEDMREISAWAKSNRYVYLLLYKDDELFFTSDMIIPDKPEPPDDSGDTDTGGENGDTGTGLPPSDGVGDGDGEDAGGESDGQGGSAGGADSGSSDESDNNTQGGTGGGSQGGSGITVDYPTREELYAYAAANDQYVIELSDGMILASVADFSEYFYYDLSNIISIALAMVVLGFVILNYFRQIIVRIKRLEADVTIVTHTNMNHKIHYRGYDEISRLSGNVENMRNSMLENIEGEREAREANTELITAMSHDIRTPLTVLFGYLDMMKSEAQDSPTLSEYIRASEKTAMRLKMLSDDMFKYSLVFGNADKKPELEDYNAVVLFEQMLSEHILLLSESGYNVVVEDVTIDGGIEVRTHAQSLMRIIDNIFSNLRKYADIKEPIRVKISADDAVFALRISNKRRTDIDNVESNGIGMKTCARLAELVGGLFKYGYKGKLFVSELFVKIKPRVEASTEEKVNTPPSILAEEGEYGAENDSGMPTDKDERADSDSGEDKDIEGELTLHQTDVAAEEKME